PPPSVLASDPGLGGAGFSLPTVPPEPAQAGLGPTPQSTLAPASIHPALPPEPAPASRGGADPLVRAERPRSALGLTDPLPGAGEWPARGPAADEGVRPTNHSQLSERAQRIAATLRQIGASFFAPLHQASGGGFPGDTQAALWELVWAGVVTNDTLHPLRNLLYAKDAERPRRELRAGPPGSPEFLRRFRARTGGSHAAEGRWSLVAQRIGTPVTPTEWSANIVRQLLARNPIVMRETAIAENIPGGYPVLYPVLRTMEENGSVGRGRFVAGMGAAQFAHTSAIDMLRALRTEPEPPEALHLAACDPANPYGSLLPWPGENHGMSRTAGSSVVLIDGALPLRPPTRQDPGRSRHSPPDPAQRPAHRRNQRGPGPRPLPRPFPRRGRLRPFPTRSPNAPHSGAHGVRA